MTIPQLVLNTSKNGRPTSIITKILNFDPHGELPKGYKQNYGIRISGFLPDETPLLYGFDIFHQITGCGLDFENLLHFCETNNIGIDWYNFVRTAFERGGWTCDSTIRKIKYPVIDVFGKDYYERLESRISSLWMNSLKSHGG